MNYHNLTAQQARHFIDHGRLLVAKRIEPQPDKVENGVALLEDMNGLHYDYESPFRIGETTKFREPWLDLSYSGHERHAYYQSEALFESCLKKWNEAKTMLSWAIRLSGKCVKVEARIGSQWTSHHFKDSGLSNYEATKLVVSLMDTWAWFATFEKKD